VFQVVIRATTATLALAIAIGATDAQSQVAIEPTGEAPSSTETDMPAVTAVYRDDLVRIDGWLDEPIWQDASVASSFIQREPVKGVHAEQPTRSLSSRRSSTRSSTIGGYQVESGLEISLRPTPSFEIEMEPEFSSKDCSG
jgi:hypothetical protein